MSKWNSMSTASHPAKPKAISHVSYQLSCARGLVCLSILDGLVYPKHVQLYQKCRGKWSMAAQVQCLNQASTTPVTSSALPSTANTNLMR